MKQNVKTITSLRHSKVCVFSVILLLALVLRLINLDAHGVWYDEKKTIGYSLGVVDIMEDYAFQIGPEGIRPNFVWEQDSSESIAESTIRLNAVNSILFNIILHYSIDLFAPSDIAVLMLSVLFSILFIALFYRFIQLLTSDMKGILLSTFLVAIGHQNIKYAQEVRAYIMADTLTTDITYRGNIGRTIVFNMIIKNEY